MSKKVEFTGEILRDVSGLVHLLYILGLSAVTPYTKYWQNSQKQKLSVVWYKYKNEWHYKPGQKVNEVKDTTGAGDAFWAAFLTQYLNTNDIEISVQYAIEIAAQKVQTFGPLYFQKKL